MEQLLNEVNGKSGIISHVFSTSEESKAEILNVLQYCLMAVIPVVFLNKIVNRFIPEPDADISTLEILAEIFFQMIIMFVGIILIHRTIQYIPTYSGFKYEPLILTNSILTFLVILLSVQSKIGVKANILFERFVLLVTGSAAGNDGDNDKKRSSSRHKHLPPGGGDTAPIWPSDPRLPALASAANAASPAQQQQQQQQQAQQQQQQQQLQNQFDVGPMAANSVFGSSFS